MATKLEHERLARLEERTEHIEELVKKIDAKLDDLDKRFITRLEFKIFKWTAGLLISGAALILGVVDRS